MCLITDQKEPKIAEEDITVYKVLSHSGYSPTQSFFYKENQLYQTNIKESVGTVLCADNEDGASLRATFGDWFLKIDTEELKSFGEGFHVIMNLERAEKFLDSACFDRCIWEAKIPKGSQYYTNPSNLGITNRLIITRKLEYGELPSNQG